MKRALKIVCLFLGGALSTKAAGLLDTGSAYERLRVQFERSYKPTLRDLMSDSIWYCSGSLEAAKGQFRYVPFWEARYRFVRPSQDTLLNSLDRRENWYKAGDSAIQGVTVLNESLRYYEFVRINRTGDLIIEMATGASYARQVTQRKKLPKALSASSLVAHQYVFCENPVQHDNRQWGNTPFKGEHKKRAQDQGSF